MGRSGVIQGMADFGIVVLDLMGGDAAYHFVDEARWNQIVAVHGAVDDKQPRWQEKLWEVVGWLTCDTSPEVDRPEGAPNREGRLLADVYTQTYVLEGMAEKGVEGKLLGILTFPGG